MNTNENIDWEKEISKYIFDILLGQGLIYKGITEEELKNVLEKFFVEHEKSVKKNK